MFGPKQYVPVLKWRQGEYQALLNLRPDIRAVITPLIEIPPIEWDFEKGKESKTIDEHLEPFSRRLEAKWGTDLAFIDLSLIPSAARMADGKHPLSFLFEQLRHTKSQAIPVTALDRDKAYQQSVKSIVASDLKGLCLRIKIDDLGGANLGERIANLIAGVGVKHKDVDLIIDLAAPNYLPIEGFTKALWIGIDRIPNLATFRTFTIAGTSFPKSMSEMTGGTQVIPRHEWLLYKHLIKTAPSGRRRPNFGDYAIAHPILPKEDMRKLKPSATVRYTIDDAWHITKGANVRDNGFSQYIKHCSGLVKSGHFLGEAFSEGDKYIDDCGAKRVRPGNLTTWRRVGTNHHLTKVTVDLSNLFGS